MRCIPDLSPPRNLIKIWLMGQPDVELRRLGDGRFEVEVHGFDYFDTARGELVSGGKSKTAVKIVDDRGIESLKVINLDAATARGV